MASKQVTRKEKIQNLYKIIPRKAIVERLLNNYSFSMIHDELKRDYVEKLVAENAWIKAAAKSTFVAILKSDNLESSRDYLKRSQAWKLQFKYPKSMPVAEIRADIHKKCLRGQKGSVRARRQNGTYENRVFERKNSPMTIEFYLARGESREYARAKIKEIAASGHLAASRCKTTKIEVNVAYVLKELGATYASEFMVMNDSDSDERSYFLYDFVLPNEKLLIEVNGDYWHANPNIYSGNDIVFETKVSDIWEKDKRKQKYGESIGYKVLIIWEHEIKQDIAKIKERIQQCMNM